MSLPDSVARLTGVGEFAVDNLKLAKQLECARDCQRLVCYSVKPVNNRCIEIGLGELGVRVHDRSSMRPILTLIAYSRRILEILMLS